MKRVVKWICAGAGVLLLLLIFALCCMYFWNKRKSAEWESASVSADDTSCAGAELFSAVNNLNARWELANVGTQKFFTITKGKGAPVVVFEGDVGYSSAEWLPVLSAMPETCTSLVYDRAGYGKSSEGEFPRTPDRIVGELESLLHALGFAGSPLVLVGAGMGGYYAQLFAAAHKSQVRGLVLVEPYAAGWHAFKGKLDPVVYKNLLDRAPALKMTGIVGKMGLIRYFNASPYEKLPDNIRCLVAENYSRTTALEAMYSEYRSGPLRPENAADIVLPNVPITVLHHSPDAYRIEMMKFYLAWNDIEDIETYWGTMLSEITSQSEQGKIVYAKESIGNIVLAEPEFVTEIVAGMILR